MSTISILIPVFNGALFIQETLDSLYLQTFQDFEIVIVDDGSVDNTSDIVLSQHSDKIRYFKNETNLGIVDTLNRGIGLCDSKYIARMDADDIALPERLQKQWNYMEAHLSTVLCGSSIERFSDKYSIKDFRGGDDDNIRAKLLFDTAINHPSAMIRTDVLKKHNLKYSHAYLHAEDYGLWVELSKYGTIANLEEILLRYRMHGNNISMKFNSLQFDTMNTIRKMLFHNFWTTTGISNETWEKNYAQLSNLENITLDDIVAMDEILNELIDANQKAQIYNNNFLKKHAAWFWYVVFIHPKFSKFTPFVAWKILRNSKSIFYKLDRIYRIKFLGKCFTFNRL